MRLTVYGQFMGGENARELLNLARTNARLGLYSMFAYTASEEHGLASNLTRGTSKHDMCTMNYKAIRDGLHMAAAAKSFSNFTPQLSTKLTFFIPSDLLVSLTRLLVHQRALLVNAMNDEDPEKVRELREYLASVVERAARLYGDREMVLPQSSTRSDPDLTGLLVNLPFSLELSHSKEFLSFVKKVPAAYKKLSENEENQLIEKWQHLNELGKITSDEGVMLILDAEQTYLQPAIETLAMDLMRKYNVNIPVIITTYQCYLKTAYQRVVRDLDIADREKFCLGLKVVRGAYLDEEKSRAVSLGYEEPVNPSYESTTEMFQIVCSLILENLTKAGQQRHHVTFATHNMNSVKYVINKMNDFGLTLEKKNVVFAQLLGMRDYITYPLAHEGFFVAKLLHYGSVEQGVAYLSRRLAENSSNLTSADLERSLLWKEIKRRLGLRTAP